MNNQRIARIATRIARDAPLNMRAWAKKRDKFFKWALKGLGGIDKKAFTGLSEIINRIMDVDPYEINNAGRGSEFPSKWNMDDFFNDVDLYSMFASLGQGETNFSRALRGASGYDRRANDILQFEEFFNDVRNVGYATLKELIDEEYGGFSRKDLTDYKRLSSKIAKWFDFFEDVEDGRKSYVENLETIIDWGGNEGPEDRMKVDKLYHTTVAAGKIKSQGFRTNSSSKGLGGATEGVSTTMSKKVAIEIANALRKMVKVAKGQVNLKTIYGWAKKAGIWNDMFGYSGYYDKMFDDFGEAKVIKMIDSGYMWKRYNVSGKMPLLDEMPAGAIPTDTVVMPTPTHPHPDGETFVKSAWVKEQRMHDDTMLHFFRVYLSAMEASGKGYDPLFFGVELKDFKGMSLGDIGTFELQVDMSNPDIKYVRGMYEYRVPVEAIQSIKAI